VTHSANALEENTINVNIIAAIRTTLSSYKLSSISDLDSASYTHLSDPRRHLRAQLFSDLIKRWQGAADPSDNQLACEERDIAMMRMIAAACLLVLLVAPLRGRTDDDFSCV
jgi:hypothetical protein